MLSGVVVAGVTQLQTGSQAGASEIEEPDRTVTGTDVTVPIALVTSLVVGVLVLPSGLLLWHRCVHDPMTVTRQADDAVAQD